MRTAARQLLWILLLPGFWLGSGGRAAAQFEAGPEYDAKGFSLYCFLGLTSRAAGGTTNKNTPFILGILGADPWKGGFPNVVSQLKKRNIKLIKDRPVVTKVFAKVDQIEKCDLLFIRTSEKKVLSRVLEVTKGDDILTVAESKDFAQMGGMVNLYVEEINGVGIAKFDVNQDAASNAGLKLELEFLDAATRRFPKR